MDKHYSQLTLKERKEIEAGLDRGDPFRGIASLIGRQPRPSPVRCARTGHQGEFS